VCRFELVLLCVIVSAGREVFWMRGSSRCWLRVIVEGGTERSRGAGKRVVLLRGRDLDGCHTRRNDAPMTESTDGQASGEGNDAYARMGFLVGPGYLVSLVVT